MADTLPMAPQLPRGAVVKPGFEAVFKTFQDLYARDLELGSAVCIHVKGEKVVDLWGGHADPDRKTNWQHDTEVNTFSACKAMLALCLLHLIDQGKANLDDPIILFWPEFANADHEAKSKVSLRHLLSHTAGLPAMKTCKAGDVFDWEAMINALELAPLLWPSGEKLAYHAITFGHLVGEVVRRISGQMPSSYFEEHFAAPLTASYGLRFRSERAGWTADCDGYSWRSRAYTSFLSQILPRFGGWKTQYFRPCNGDYHPNSKAWRSCEAPAISGFGNARGLSKVYAMLAAGGEMDGQRYFSKEIADQIAGLPDRPELKDEQASGMQVRIGLGFFFNHGPLAGFGPNPNNFGHCGMGGSTAFSDIDNNVSFAYVCNHLHTPPKSKRAMVDERAQSLITSLYECL